jgi:hypothetical protein
MKYYFPKHFDIKEFVPPEVYKLGEERAYMMLDQNMLKMMDGLREFFGVPIYVNNWSLGGSRSYRGYRTPDCNVGAAYSQHKFGRAADMDIEGYAAEDARDARDAIIKNQKSPLLNWITCLEDDVSWVHADCRNIKTETIVLFKP